MQTAQKTLPPLFGIDTKGKNRVWKCWVIDDTLFREHGLVTGKKILSERKFEGKSIGKKNETTPEEQAWMEANKEWIAHITKEYSPHPDDKEGMKMIKLLTNEKKKTGGHCGNSVAVISSGEACKTKTVSRKKSDTCMVETIEGGPIIPMKAQVWLDDPQDPYSVSQNVLKYFSTVAGKGKTAKLENMQFLVQKKIDGIRARIMVQLNKSGEQEVVITSNSGKQLPFFRSIRKAILDWTSSLKSLEDLLDGLDGELYSDTFIDNNGSLIQTESRFSTISSICGMSRSAPHELEDQIQFHCFDLIDKSSTFTQTERFKILDNLFKKLPKCYDTKIIKVKTETFDNIEDLVKYHTLQVSLGYEGIMIRSPSLKYKPKSRAPELRKFKTVLDAEYEIVGTLLDKGTSVENFVFVLKTENGDEFNCKPMGSKVEKIEWYKNKEQLVGKFLTVKYQELSSDGIPRFPIGKSIRKGPGVD